MFCPLAYGKRFLRQTLFGYGCAGERYLFAVVFPPVNHFCQSIRSKLLYLHAQPQSGNTEQESKINNNHKCADIHLNTYIIKSDTPSINRIEYHLLIKTKHVDDATKTEIIFDIVNHRNFVFGYAYASNIIIWNFWVLDFCFFFFGQRGSWRRRRRWWKEEKIN